MKLSESKYNVTVREKVLIPTRDGVNLAAYLYMPDALGKFPAVMTYRPYRRDLAVKLGTGAKPFEFARRGYVYVFLDMRGTGSSEGHQSEGLRSQQWEDGYDAVEWISQQPWCDGNVGMEGISAGGGASINVASLNPPHLKAIIPAMIGGTENAWAHPGGVMRCLGLNVGCCSMIDGWRYGITTFSITTNGSFHYMNIQRKTNLCVKAISSYPGWISWIR